MPLSRSDFCRLYFSELDRQGIPYVILHSYETFPDQIGSDVDYAVPTRDLSRLVSLQRGLAERQGWCLAHVVEAHIYAVCSVVVNLEDPSIFLQLDACGHYVEGGCFVLRDAALLENRRPWRGYFVPAPAIEFAYLLAKALAKGQPVAPRLPRLRELWQRDPEATEAQFRNLVGPVGGSLRQWFERSPTDWGSLRPVLLKWACWGPGDRFRETFRAWKRIAQPKGLHLASLGLDDSRISTLLDRLGSLIGGPLFSRQLRFEFQPSFFKRGERGAVASYPHENPPRNRIGAAAVLLCYAGAYLARYCAVAWPAKVQNKLIIFDRSFDDIIIHPRRYRFPAAGWLARLLRWLLPRADLTLVLDAEPEQVHARKPELSLEDLRRQRAALQQLARDGRRYVLLSAEQPPDEMARVAFREVVRFLTERQNRAAQP